MSWSIKIKNRVLATLLGLYVASSVLLAIWAAAQNAAHSEQSSHTMTSINFDEPLTGPNGNIALAAETIQLSTAEYNLVKNGAYKAALVWHGSGHWVSALSAGAKDTFELAGIQVVAETDAEYNPAQQANDIENVMALKPDIILTLAVDGISAESAFQPAVSNNVNLVLLSNPIANYEPGQDYIGIVTADMWGMGKAAAYLMRDILDGSGNVGLVYFDADFFITNNRDGAFKSSINNKLSGLENLNIVSELGFSAENEVSNIVSAMVQQNPDIEGIYVSWDTAAEGAVEALRLIGSSDVKVITHDLGANNLLDLSRNGNFAGTISDRPYEIGQAMARLAIYGILDKPAPEFSVVGYDVVTKSNALGIWKSAFRAEPPAILQSHFNL